MSADKVTRIDDLVLIKLRSTKGTEKTTKKVTPPEEPYEVSLPDQTPLYRHGRRVLDDFDKIVDPEGLIRKKLHSGDMYADTTDIPARSFLT